MRVAESFSPDVSFSVWLLRQGERRDAVGALARSARRDRRFVATTRPADLWERFRRSDAGGRAFAALDAAEGEWRRAGRRSSGMADKREADPRKVLADQADRAGVSLAELSRMLSRGDGYLGRFVREGAPLALTRADHQALADFFGTDERGMGVRDLWAHGERSA